MATLTVKDLKEILKDLPDDTVVDIFDDTTQENYEFIEHKFSQTTNGGEKLLTLYVEEIS